MLWLGPAYTVNFCYSKERKKIVVKAENAKSEKKRIKTC